MPIAHEAEASRSLEIVLSHRLRSGILAGLCLRPKQKPARGAQKPTLKLLCYETGKHVQYCIRAEPLVLAGVRYGSNNPFPRPSSSHGHPKIALSPLPPLGRYGVVIRSTSSVAANCLTAGDRFVPIIRTSQEFLVIEKVKMLSSATAGTGATKRIPPCLMLPLQSHLSTC